MIERLIDILNDKNNLLHVLPVQIESYDPPLKQADFEQEAVKAAIAAEIVAPTEASKLKARPHVSRGGPLMPCGDVVQTRNEQQMRLEERIRQRAYFLWQEAGYPDNQAEEFWHHAREIQFASTD